ncbi:MAG: GTP-binding protein [Pirellulales bacterium]
MQRLRFVMLGGFLGAGKTTTLARLARYYTDRGQRVALVTNDQAQNLVDTGNLRAQGFSVEEVAGACFCCRFNELVGKVQDLAAAERPDLVLAEPVGSCTDLVATVIQPLKALYGRQFQVAPYAVLFKPSHGLRILRDEPSAGFSPKAAYIFKKQLDEADAIVVNRLDELAPAQLDELVSLVGSHYPSTPLLRMSARTGQGLAQLVEFLELEGSFGNKILDIDYDVYAEGEAELGWLNTSLRIEAQKPFALDELLLAVLERLRDSLAAADGEVAHLKLIGLGDTSFGVANLVSTLSEPELSVASQARLEAADLVVNARVAIDPTLLEQQVRQAVEATCHAYQASARFGETQSLRPGRPVPTHRYATAQ